MKKFRSIILIAFCVLLVLSLIFPIVHAHIANIAFDALFTADRLVNPGTVLIVSNSQKTVFRKSTDKYDRLVQILRNGRSQGSFDQAGMPPRLDSKFAYGEMVIYQYGIPSTFKLFRSTENDNYFWISVPHPSGHGTHYPLFAFGRDFVNLINSTASKSSQ